MSLYMTPAELADLIDTPVRALQIAWLDRNRWEYQISRLGNPKVLRAYMERRMGLVDEKSSAHTEPDFSHWKSAA